VAASAGRIVRHGLHDSRYFGAVWTNLSMEISYHTTGDSSMSGLALRCTDDFDADATGSGYMFLIAAVLLGVASG